MSEIYLLVKLKDLQSAAQQIHQGYHGDQSGTWRECPRNVCDLFRQIIEQSIQYDISGGKNLWTYYSGSYR